MKKLKLLYIANSDLVFFQRLASFFIHKGHDIYVIPAFRPKTKIDGVNYYYIPNITSGGLLSRLKAYRKVRQIIKILNPDILHSLSIRPCGWLATFSAFHPHILSVMGSDILINPHISVFRKYLTSLTLKKADLVTAESKTVLKQATKFGALGMNILLWQWGINLNEFNSYIDSFSLKKELGLDDCFVILSTRNFKSIYNIDTIIKSIPIVLSRIPNACFLFKGYKWDNEYKKKLFDLINTLEIPNCRVRFIDYVEYEKMPLFYSLADIFVSVPSSDSLSVSLLEAMACGAVPIVSDLPANREVITNGKNGYIVPVHDEDALAEAIIYLYYDKEIRISMRRKNLEFVAEYADEKKHLARMEDIYYKMS